jgi:hypothetical protein
VALCTGVGQENTDLAVLDPSRRPGILARHAGRPGSLLQEPGLVDDQHAVRRAQVLDHITATQVARLVLVPQDMRQNPLGAPGSAVPDRFGQLPAVLALGRAPSRYRPAWRRGSGRPNNSPTRRCNSANASRHPASPAGFNTNPIPNQNLR